MSSIWSKTRVQLDLYRDLGRMIHEELTAAEQSEYLTKDQAIKIANSIRLLLSTGQDLTSTRKQAKVLKKGRAHKPLKENEQEILVDWQHKRSLIHHRVEKYRARLLTMSEASALPVHIIQAHSVQETNWMARQDISTVPRPLPGRPAVGGA